MYNLFTRVARILLTSLAAFVAVQLAGCGTPYATVAGANSKQAVMLLGYDPTAYFTEGKPVRGIAAHQVRLEDRTYYFVSEQTKALFAANPAKYEPQYGGFCASGATFAIKLGSDPSAWEIVDGRLFIFGDVLGKKAWQLDPQWNVDHADRLWPQIKDSGWRGQTLKSYVFKVPHYQSGAQIVDAWKKKDPNTEWPRYDTGGMWKNLFMKPPGWRAAEGFSQEALGYPE